MFEVIRVEITTVKIIMDEVTMVWDTRVEIIMEEVNLVEVAIVKESLIEVTMIVAPSRTFSHLAVSTWKEGLKE